MKARPVSRKSEQVSSTAPQVEDSGAEHAWGIPAGNDPIRASILVVDDEEANLVAMRTVLEELGQPVVCARSGEDALRLLLDQEFALILLDVLMPGMDGYETATVIRSRQKTRHVPIIFLSAMDRDQSHLYRGYSAGAVDFVFKPVEAQILRSKVSVFVELHIKIQEVRLKAEHEKRLLAENLAVRRQQSQTARALKRSEARQSLVIESLPIALWVSSSGDNFQSRQFVGGNTESLCGLSPDKFSRSRKIWLSRIHDDDRDQVLEALDAAKTTGFFSMEYRWRRADGSYGWFYDRGSLSEAAGSPDEMFGIWLDVSDRRTLEQQLAHAQKLEALGQMTGGIAHDFNNMLSVILGSLGLIDREALGNPKTARRIDLATQAANSCADLTNRLLGFAKRQALEPVVISLEEELAGLRDLLVKTLGKNIALTCTCPKDCWPVYLDASQLEAALVNLVINARDAMADGGNLSISCRNLTVDDAARCELDLKAGAYVELEIADTGTGMPDDVRQKAFEPFFTTKGVNKGTGLGLSTIYGFVKQSGGTVTIDSAQGRGTSVRMYLPRAGAAAGRRTRHRGLTHMVEDSVVLVVDDDEKVREVAVLMLEGLGYVTVQACDGTEALARLGDTVGIALLFSDCVMPGEFDGEALAQEAVRRYPGLPILLTSAYRKSAETDSEPGRLASFPFLAKPYSAAQLSDAIKLATAPPADAE